MPAAHEPETAEECCALLLKVNAPISLAAKAGNTDSVEALLDAGADVNGHTDCYLIHTLTRTGTPETVRKVLGRMKRDDLYANQHYVSILEHIDRGDIQATYKAMEDADAPTSNSSHHWADFTSAIEAKDITKARRICAGFAPENRFYHTSNWRYITALHVAARIGAAYMIETLIDEGAGVNQPCKKRKRDKDVRDTSLDIVRENGHARCVALLETAGATSATSPAA